LKGEITNSQTSLAERDDCVAAVTEAALPQLLAVLTAPQSFNSSIVEV
jgi:hypothetical protein